jgi:hypothetical protein
MNFGVVRSVFEGASPLCQPPLEFTACWPPALRHSPLQALTATQNPEFPSFGVWYQHWKTDTLKQNKKVLNRL